MCVVDAVKWRFTSVLIPLENAALFSTHKKENETNFTWYTENTVLDDSEGKELHKYNWVNFHNIRQWQKHNSINILFHNLELSKQQLDFL